MCNAFSIWFSLKVFIFFLQLYENICCIFLPAFIEVLLIGTCTRRYTQGWTHISIAIHICLPVHTYVSINKWIFYIVTNKRVNALKWKSLFFFFVFANTIIFMPISEVWHMQWHCHKICDTRECAPKTSGSKLYRN